MYTLLLYVYVRVKRARDLMGWSAVYRVKRSGERERGRKWTTVILCNARIRVTTRTAVFSVSFSFLPPEWTPPRPVLKLLPSLLLPITLSLSLCHHPSSHVLAPHGFDKIVFHCCARSYGIRTLPIYCTHIHRHGESFNVLPAAVASRSFCSSRIRTRT